MLRVAVLGAILVWMTPPTLSQTAILRGHSYTISPKPCSVNGAEGTCMFVWECIKTEGRHVGMCVDQFMFGSCCVHNATENLLQQPSLSSSEPAVLFSPPGPAPSTVPLPPSSSTVSSTTSVSSSTTSPFPSTSQQQQHGHTVAFITRPASVNWGHHAETANTGGLVDHQPPGGSTGGTTAALTGTTVLQFVTSSSSSSSTFAPPTALTTAGTTITEQDMMADTVADGSTAVGSWTLLQTLPGHTWQATTQPSFVTRPRPHPGSTRPRPPLRPRPPHRPARPPVVAIPPPTTTAPATSTRWTTIRRTTTTASTTTSTTTTTTPPPTTTTTTTTPRPSSVLPATSTIPHEIVTNGHRDARCGVPPLFPRPETRIVGGKDSPFGGWPWQVSVRRTSFFGFSSTHRCGGALLNENWIATAGHCVDDLLTSQIRIRVGEYDFSSVQEPLPFVERSVSQKVVHPKYNFFTYEYDLALVRLESPLQFQQHIAPICLPASDDLLIGENATVTGWGRLSEGGTLPSVLQEVTIPIVSNDKCKNMFLRAGRHEFIPEIFLCAGYDTGGQDSCQGDSGGPLQVRGKDGRYFLAGIISWGIGCAEANLPGVCTRISKFVPWILEHVT